MPTFPSYAKLLFADYAEQRESAILRTDMESGPAKQAKVKSRVMVTRPVKIRFDSKPDYLAFVQWFASDLVEGSAWFTFVDPVDGQSKSARFVGGGLEGRPLERTLKYWTISHKIESWG